jgi:hypothetical protein
MTMKYRRRLKKKKRLRPLPEPSRIGVWTALT